MEKNVFFTKCKVSKENPYGLKIVPDDFALDKPTLISLVPVVTKEKDLNGAINVAGQAIGIARRPEHFVENINMYSWEDVEDTGIQFVSAYVFDAQSFYEKYFHPILFDKNGDFKDFNTLIKNLRNINIACYCDSTRDVEKISKFLEEDLLKSGKFSEKEVNQLLNQICVVDVTSRILPGTSKLTTIHLYSKFDIDLRYPQFIRDQENGIGIFENGHEALVIIDKLLNGGPEDEHNYSEYFSLFGNKTSRGEVMGIISNILLSNMLNSSLENRTLTGNNLEELSFIFNQDVMEFFNALLQKEIVSQADLSKALENLQLSRKLPQKFLRSKEEVTNIMNKDLNYRKFNAVKIDIMRKLNLFSGYLELDSKFQNTSDYDSLTDNQKSIFAQVRQYCCYNIVILEENLKNLVELSLETSDKNEIEKISELLLEIEEEVNKIDLQKINKSQNIIDTFVSLRKIKDGDALTISQWGSEEDIRKSIDEGFKSLEK